MSEPRLNEIELYAWLGEDERGSGEIGLKQAMCPAGCIPMVAVKLPKMQQDYIRKQLDSQGKAFGKCITLCRFKFDDVVEEVGTSMIREPGLDFVMEEEPKNRKVSVGDVIRIDGTFKEVIAVHPHQDIPDACYYEFEDGFVERDVRLHPEAVYRRDHAQ